MATFTVKEIAEQLKITSQGVLKYKEELIKWGYMQKVENSRQWVISDGGLNYLREKMKKRLGDINELNEIKEEIQEQIIENKTNENIVIEELKKQIEYLKQRELEQRKDFEERLKKQEELTQYFKDLAEINSRRAEENNQRIYALLDSGKQMTVNSEEEKKRKKFLGLF